MYIAIYMVYMVSFNYYKKVKVLCAHHNYISLIIFQTEAPIATPISAGLEVKKKKQEYLFWRR